MKPVRAAIVIGSTAATLLVLFACSPENNPSGPGEECFAAGDCEPGLVCVPQRSGARLCSNDLSQVTGRPPPEAGSADAPGPDEGGTEDATTPPDEAGPPDATAPDAAVDAAIVDAGDAG